jgi:hypothetical protein
MKKVVKSQERTAERSEETSPSSRHLKRTMMRTMEKSLSVILRRKREKGKPQFPERIGSKLSSRNGIKDPPNRCWRPVLVC